MTKDTRFQKGRSGNPTGRPKGRSWSSTKLNEADELTLAHADRLISVREGGVVTQVPVIDAVFKAQEHSALKGSSLAQKHLIDRFMQALAKQREAIDEEVEWATDYVAKASYLLADAKRRGMPEPNLPIHPDDVVIDQERGVRFVGPVGQHERAQLQETLELRNLLLMQYVLDERQRDRSAGLDEQSESAAMLFAVMLNDRMPERFRLSELEIILVLAKHERLTKRELLKQIYRAWQALRRPIARGKQFPSVAVAKQTFEMALEALRDASAAKSSPSL
jgi:hypothetical protein